MAESDISRSSFFSDKSVVDKWVKCADKESLLMCRRLIREEGLLCGGSSGSAVWAAMEVLVS